MLNSLGISLYERARQERGEARRARREEILRESAAGFERVLELDPENVTAHFNLDRVYKDLGEKERAASHFELYKTYKPDDNARDLAVATARKNDPAADHAAEAIVIYDLGRGGAPELDSDPRERRAAAFELQPLVEAAAVEAPEVAKASASSVEVPTAEAEAASSGM